MENKRLMENKNDEEDKIVMDALYKAYKKMLERMARLGEPVYTKDDNGIMKFQDAREVYERNYGPLPPVERMEHLSRSNISPD